MRPLSSVSEVLAELHLLTQFDQDSKPYLPIILAGQSPLIDQLIFRTSRPLASRIIARSHLQGVDRQEMADYLAHHLALVGLKTNPLEEAAITAIQQGSGGLFRKANHLAKVHSLPLLLNSPRSLLPTMSVWPPRKYFNRYPAGEILSLAAFCLMSLSRMTRGGLNNLKLIHLVHLIRNLRPI